MIVEPCIALNGNEIPVKDTQKFLGILLNKKLTFIPHIQQLKMKCMQSLNILKVLSHQSYGTDKTCLLRIFRSLIISKIDYASIVYSLKMLNAVYHL